MDLLCFHIIYKNKASAHLIANPPRSRARKYRLILRQHAGAVAAAEVIPVHVVSQGLL
eukprot:COSAG02_NODE_30507_length_549_cov_2.153333_1_plen_57_part_10